MDRPSRRAAAAFRPGNRVCPSWPLPYGLQHSQAQLSAGQAACCQAWRRCTPLAGSTTSHSAVRHRQVCSTQPAAHPG
eukprot:scaffold15142_cov32-Tisochrysis_lutea.AAC.1